MLNKGNRRADKKHPPGLTFIELIITIFVMGILIIIATPNIVLLSFGYELRGATRTVATDLKYARQMAIKENRNFQVTFSASSYQVVRVSDGSVVKSINIVDDYPGVTLSNGSITFYPRGNSSSNFTVSLQNPWGFKSVQVALTGKVRIA